MMQKLNPVHLFQLSIFIIESECINAHIKLVVETQPYIRGANKGGISRSSDVSSSDTIENIVFELSEDKLDLLVQELTDAAKVLDNVDK